MITKNVKAIYSVIAISITAFIAVIVFHVTGVSVNSDMTRLFLSSNSAVVRNTAKTNVVSPSPRIESITIGNNGKTQIRGFANSDWLLEGQASVEIQKDNETVESFICFAEGVWMTEGEIPFLCETSLKVEGDSYSLKINKIKPSGEGQSQESIILNLVK